MSGVCPVKWEAKLTAFFPQVTAFQAKTAPSFPMRRAFIVRIRSLMIGFGVEHNFSFFWALVSLSTTRTRPWLATDLSTFSTCALLLGLWLSASLGLGLRTLWNTLWLGLALLRQRGSGLDIDARPTPGFFFALVLVLHLCLALLWLATSDNRAFDTRRKSKRQGCATRVSVECASRV